MVNTNEKKALTELNYIINNMSKELSDKIPNELKELIKQNMDDEYIMNVDITKKMSQQKFMPETRALLSVLVSDYLCDNIEKEKWEQFDKTYEMLINRQNENVGFIKKKQNTNIEHNSSNQIVEYKESILKKVWTWIVRFFKKDT